MSHAVAVRQEISDETDRRTGKTKAISNVPIQLSQHIFCTWYLFPSPYLTDLITL